MPDETMNRTICFGCEQPIGADQVFSHFENCSGNQPAPRHLCPALEQTFMIRVANKSQFWLLAEARGSTKLENLYMFLRGNWYECCGYIGPFVLNGKDVPKEFMQKSLNDIFSAGDTFRYSSNSDMPNEVCGEVTAVHHRVLLSRVDERCESCVAEMN